MNEIREMLRINLKNQIEKSKYSQKEFSEIVGVKPAAVSQWINGKNSPDIETIAKICDALNIRFSDLITYPDELKDIKQAQLFSNYQNLNDIGKAKLLEYSEDLVNSGNYIIQTQKEKRA